MLERVEYEDKTYALILRYGYERDGVDFITPPENPLQLGVLKRKKGTYIKPHIHSNLSRTIDVVQEVLHIEYGKIKVEFFTSTGEKLGEATLNTGDTILFISGGHGFSILENSKILEVKQGPYYGIDKDKERFNIEKEGEG